MIRNHAQRLFSHFNGAHFLNLPRLLPQAFGNSSELSRSVVSRLVSGQILVRGDPRFEKVVASLAPK
jgi:hypothetical protein